MPRISNSKNKSNYHYTAQYYDEQNQVYKLEHFFTRDEIISKFHISKMLINLFLKDVNYRTRKNKSLIIRRVNIPVYKKVQGAKDITF